MKYKVHKGHVCIIDNESTLSYYASYLKYCIGTDKNAKVRFKELGYYNNIVVVFFPVPIKISHGLIVVKENFYYISKEEFDKYYEIV